MLKIPKDLLDTLLELRATQSLHPNNPEFFINNPVVILTLGMGPELYLGLDGRVFILEWMNEAAGIHETTDSRDAAAGLVIAARRFNLPDLERLIPPRPADAIDCDACQQTRWLSIPGFTDTQTQQPVEIVCSQCGGLAWHRPT
jgi:hypothetical protein